VVGIACVVLGALIFLLVHLSIDRRQSVLVVARAVSAGEVITNEDLAVAEMTVSSEAGSIPASDAEVVVGKTAAVNLVPKAVLAPAQVGPSSTLQAGQVVVGVLLKAGQAPLGLRTGTRVQVVDNGTGSQASEADPTVVSASAVVTAMGRPESASGGTSVVSLTLPATDAASVASAGAAGRVSLVVLPA
jgi:hypothetical protein